MTRNYTFAFFLLCCGTHAIAQDDLLKMLDQETAKDKKPELTTATFKTTRLMNGHTVENVAPGVLDLRISHRFGPINSGPYEFWGLDQASMRLGFDYGISKRLMVGVGRSTYQKQYDGFMKFKILRQAGGGMPVTASLMSSMMMKTLHFTDPNRPNYYTSQLYFANQLLIAKKISEGLSLQLMPTMIHYNLVTESTTPNDILAIGGGGRLKLTKRVSLNAEYYYQLPGHKLPGTTNSLSIGFDIETGGHVFQLLFTNSVGMTERTFIAETTGKFFNGDVRFGFNISRVFTVVDPRKKTKQ